MSDSTMSQAVFQEHSCLFCGQASASAVPIEVKFTEAKVPIIAGWICEFCCPIRFAGGPVW